MAGHSDQSLPRFNFRPVVPGRLYRSAEPVMLGATEWKALVEHIGLTTVLDLRMTVERDERGRPVVVKGVEYLSVPLFEATLPQWVDPDDRSPAATALRYLEMLEAGVDTVVSIVRRLGNAHQGPTLIHCAAGRDRTGIVVAMILDLCGVGEDRIAADYALSQGVVADGGDADPQTIRSLLELIRTQYGSVEQLLADRGLGRGEAAAVKSFLGKS